VAAEIASLGLAEFSQNSLPRGKTRGQMKKNGPKVRCQSSIACVSTRRRMQRREQLRGDVSIGAQSLVKMRAEPGALADRLVELAAAVWQSEEDREAGSRLRAAALSAAAA
jgi:hypothetical protein